MENISLDCLIAISKENVEWVGNGFMVTISQPPLFVSFMTAAEIPAVESRDQGNEYIQREDVRHRRVSGI